MRREAKAFFKRFAASHHLSISPVFLRKSTGDRWRRSAVKALKRAELAIVYDAEACKQSSNTQWEVAKAKDLSKPVINLSRQDIESSNVRKLLSVYDFDDEFKGCFADKGVDKDQLLDIYKIIVASSEDLINRRQTMNRFFITLLGVIAAACGFVARMDIGLEGFRLVLAFPIIFGLMLCWSWHNLIANYGKLNVGKFRVIHKLEEQLGVKAYTAEWIALGKGLRKEKYQSFTATEQNVPWLVAALLVVILVVLIINDWGLIADWAVRSPGQSN